MTELRKSNLFNLYYDNPDIIEFKDIDGFARAIRAPSRGLWNGSLDIFDFFEAMELAIQRGYENAWNEGAASCNIQPDERTAQEQQELNRLIQFNRQYIFSYGEFVEQNSRDNDGKLGTVFSRADLWINRYNQVRARAQSMACADQKLMWIWQPDKEHCADCRKLNGKVYRASVWDEIGILPQSEKLACHGYRCGCALVLTDAKATPGRRPSYG